MMTQNAQKTYRVVVGLGSCGIAAGAQEVLAHVRQKIEAEGWDAQLEITGCNGMCHREPLVEVHGPEGSVLYGDMTPKKVDQVFESHLKKQTPVERFRLREREADSPAAAFLAKQRRIVLRNCGVIDPEDIAAYQAAGGWTALPKALEKGPDWVLAEMKASGLRGRGGAGFPTGLKWEFARKAPGSKKIVVCNADEGDPGAFMDRSVLESDPHSVIEGMAVAAATIGASSGYIYCRAEYPLAVKRLNIAIAQARAAGFLGENILGSGFSFDIKVKEGAGAFVCGEETALLASIEGKRGMPRPRPPFPAQKGLWGLPTNINNVETYANVPWILLNGGAAFASVGTEKSRGTKVFALAGKIRRGGLAEVPMGITIREIVEDVAGGSSTGRAIKAVQMGGPSGGCIPADLFDTRIDYDEVNRTGAIMGSGGLVVMDETTCMVDVARFFLNFTRNESCGKCTFCRIGTTRMLELLEAICAGRAEPKTLELLEDLAHHVKNTSLCGLGQTAPNPVLTTLRYFRHEYEAHILEKRCPAGVCKALTTFWIDPAACTGCDVCASNCPVQAIAGVRGQKGSYVIDEKKCTRCGVCREVCRFGAVHTR